MQKLGTITLWLFTLIITVAVLAALFFIIRTEPLKNLILSLAIIVIVFGVLLITGIYFHKESTMRRLLKELMSRLHDDPPEALKDQYLKAYNTYMKLSEKQKQNFYTRLARARETMEEEMQAEKDIQHQLQQAESAPLTALAELYKDIHLTYQRLPGKVQQRYYGMIANIKGKLQGTHP